MPDDGAIHVRSGTAGKPAGPAPDSAASLAPSAKADPADADALSRQILADLGLEPDDLALALDRARANATTVEAELVAAGLASEAQIWSAMARRLGIAFLPSIDPHDIVPSAHLAAQLGRPALVRLDRGTAPPLIVRAPSLADAGDIAAALSAMPLLAERLALATPTALREALWQVEAEAQGRRALNQLFDHQPEASARIVLKGGQGFVAGLVLAVLAAMILAWPNPVLLACHGLVSGFHAAAILLRSMALVHLVRRPVARRLERTDRLPVYSVLVPLHKEAAIVGQLLARIDMLDWPRSLLDVKIICEADDAETLAALAAARPGPHIEIIRVPVSLPRTKPKALCYALAAVRGEFLVVYDAEDKPHPGQMREAHQAFRSAGQDLACLQAPLVIDNGGAHWLASLFALEYAALFRGLLPVLALLSLPLPLGGTSNHFRVAALVNAGAWDPYNVTEDADLGVRLRRLGYRTAMIARPTFEAAPVDFSTWRGQRARWFKGWMQTWLVIMRQPIASTQQLGMAGALAFHLMISGMLVAALSHPFLIIAIVWMLAAGRSAGPQEGLDLLLWHLDLANVAGCYLVLLLTGWLAMTGLERRRVGRHLPLLPLYWLAMSLAAWMALVELRRRPFFWTKTGHDPPASPVRHGDGLPAPNTAC